VVSQTFPAPAKLNLFLAITGKRADGFHDLVSLVAPITVADTLTVNLAPDGEFRLTCSDPNLASDETNLVLKAARAFVTRTGWRGGASFHLEKRVPTGAGLGGGSSDGVAALRAVNELAGRPLGESGLLDLAATLGSDCPLFVPAEPLIMRGRGERIERLSADVVQRIRGRRVLVFKPDFAIPTAWAYRRLAEMAVLDASQGSTGDATKASRPQEQPSSVYLATIEAERRLDLWRANAGSALESLLFNNLELPAFEKFVALPTLLEDLRARFGLSPRMSGSGSACFAPLPDQFDATPVITRIRAAWGESAFVADTRLA
jgi:4-diphosphocytidyl-2-C-methyl-D-erythritol kinase